MTTSTQQDIFRFLIVDDSRAIQSIIRRALESCGYPALDIRVASDGEVALSMLDDFVPDLIITDWHMPKMSGLEFCQQIKQLFHGRIPIGFVTTEASHDRLEEARRNGASFIINKPFKDDQFTEIILGTVPLTRTPSIASTQDNLSTDDLIIDTKACNKGLSKYIQNHEFSLMPCKPIILPELTEDNLIGLYGFGLKPHPVAGVAVMDMRTVAMLWGLHTGKDSASIKQAISHSKPQEGDYLQAAHAFMEEMGPIIKVAADKEPLRLTRSSIFNRTFQRLEIVLKTNSGRADFQLKVPGLGEGLIAFVLV